MNIYHILKSAEYFEKISTFALQKIAQKAPTLALPTAPAAGGTGPTDKPAAPDAGAVSEEDLSIINAVLEYLGAPQNQLARTNIKTWQQVLSARFLNKIEDLATKKRLPITFQKNKDSKQQDLDAIKKYYIKNVKTAKQAKEFEEFLKGNRTFQSLKTFIDGYVQKSGNMREWGVQVYYTSMPIAPHSSNITVYTFPPNEQGQPEKKVSPLTTLVQKQFGANFSNQVKNWSPNTNYSQLIYKTDPVAGAKEQAEMASEVSAEADYEKEFNTRLVKVVDYVGKYAQSLENIKIDQLNQVPNFISSLNSYFDYYAKSVDDMIPSLQQKSAEIKRQFTQLGGDLRTNYNKPADFNSNKFTFQQSLKLGPQRAKQIKIYDLQQSYKFIDSQIEKKYKLLPAKFKAAKDKLGDLYQQYNDDPSTNPFVGQPLKPILDEISTIVNPLAI